MASSRRPPSYFSIASSRYFWASSECVETGMELNSLRETGAAVRETADDAWSSGASAWAPDCAAIKGEPKTTRKPVNRHFISMNPQSRYVLRPRSPMLARAVPWNNETYTKVAVRKISAIQDRPAPAFQKLHHFVRLVSTHA